jgi:hypothetical protein
LPFFYLRKKVKRQKFFGLVDEWEKHIAQSDPATFVRQTHLHLPQSDFGELANRWVY